MQRGNTGVTGFSRTVRSLEETPLLFSPCLFRTRPAEASARSTLSVVGPFARLEKAWLLGPLNLRHKNPSSAAPETREHRFILDTSLLAKASSSEARDTDTPKGNAFESSACNRYCILHVIAHIVLSRVRWHT